MKRISTCFLIVLFAISLAKAGTVYEQISSVNKEWFKPAFANNPYKTQQINSQLSEQELVRLHLKSTESYLRTINTDNLTAAQKTARAKNLDLLKGYYIKGEFPRNLTHKGRIPVFVDDRNVPCAVGYLMLCAGYTEFVNQTTINSNNIYIHQIQSDVFNKFQLESGLTTDELALIQPSYGEHIVFDRFMSPDVNISTSVLNEKDGMMYVAGRFSQFNGEVYLNNIAKFDGERFFTIENNLNGDFRCMAFYNNELYIGGLFSIGKTAQVLALAKFDGENWSFINVEGEVNAMTVYNNKLYIGGDFTKVAGEVVHHIASYDAISNKWDNAGAELNGRVNVMTVHKGSLVIGGAFAENNFEYHMYLSELKDGTWKPLMESPINAEVTALHSGPGGYVNSSERPTVLYVGTSKKDVNDTHHKIILAVKEDTAWVDKTDEIKFSLTYNNTDMDSLFSITGFQTIDQEYPAVITMINYAGEGRMTGMYGSYNAMMSNLLLPYKFGTKVNDVKYYKDNLYVAAEGDGVFKSDLVVSVRFIGNTDQIKIIRKTRDYIELRVGETIPASTELMLVDAMGNTVESYTKINPTASPTIQINTASLTTGAYFLRINTDGNIHTAKLLVSE